MMTDHSKVKPDHLQRDAFVYVRQSTPSQVEHNRESTERQYALANRAVELGWPRERVTVVYEDLGLSGSSADKRSGFARLIAAVASAWWALCWASKSLVWHVTMPTGTAYSTCVP